MNFYTSIAQYIHWRPYLDILFHALQDSEIPFLVLKGWAFIPDLYPDPTVGRPMGDIDLLVKPQDFSNAVKLLFDLGYKANSKYPNYGFDKGSSHLPEELAFANAVGVAIDLHQHIFPTFWSKTAYPIDMDVVWNSRQPYKDWCGDTLERLSPELNFLHLISHITRHGLGDTQQKSCMDLVRLIQKYAPIVDFRHIQQLAKDWELRCAMFFVIRQCQRCFGLQFPSGLSDNWRPGAFRIWWVEKVLLRIWKRHPARDHWFLRVLLNLAMVEKPVKAIGLLGKVLFPSADARYHLHGFSISLGMHYVRLMRRVVGMKAAI